MREIQYPLSDTSLMRSTKILTKLHWRSCFEVVRTYLTTKLPKRA